MHATSADQFNTLREFSERLARTCVEGEAGTLVWKPDETTPNLVYYQVSYNT